MSDKAVTDRPSLGGVLKKPAGKTEPPQVAGFAPPTPEPDPKPQKTPKKANPKAKAAAGTGRGTTKKTRGTADAGAAAPRAEPAHVAATVRTATRLPRSLSKRVRGAARNQKVGRARLLLIAFLEHETDLPRLLHPEPAAPSDPELASVGLEPDQASEPTDMVTWELPTPGMTRLDETCRQHGVTRTALIRAVLEAAYPEQKQP